MRIIWSSFAEADLDAFVRHVASDNLAAALDQDERIRDAVEHLADQPRMGRIGRLAETRELVVSGTPCIIVYRVREEQIEIVRVLHGARDWPRPGG